MSECRGYCSACNSLMSEFYLRCTQCMGPLVYSDQFKIEDRRKSNQVDVQSKLTKSVAERLFSDISSIKRYHDQGHELLHLIGAFPERHTFAVHTEDLGCGTVRLLLALSPEQQIAALRLAVGSILRPIDPLYYDEVVSIVLRVSVQSSVANQRTDFSEGANG